MTRFRTTAAALAAGLSLFVAGCADGGSREDQRQPQQTAQAEPRIAKIDAAQAQRLQRIMGPLIAKMDKPLPAGQVKMTVWDDPHINAANGGGGDFYVTTGLLTKANDDQLRAILAHEVAHADLGHVAETQTVATGLGIGVMLLEQIIPGSSALTPIAGQFILSAYSRSEETEADAHAVEIMKRNGQDGKTLMAGALTWLQRTEGGSGGGFFATHPPTGDRIAAVQKLP